MKWRYPILSAALLCILLLGVIIVRLPQTAFDLIRAVETGDVTAVRIALESGASPNLTFNKYHQITWSLLHEAASNGDSQTAQLLLDAGADPNASATDGKTPLMVLLVSRAGEPNSLNTFYLLLERSTNLDSADSTGRTALHYAARHRTSVYVAALLERKVALNAIDQIGQNALHHATSRRDDEMYTVIEMLLKAGGDRNRLDVNNDTPLQAANKPDDPRLRTLFDAN